MLRAFYVLLLVLALPASAEDGARTGGKTGAGTQAKAWSPSPAPAPAAVKDKGKVVKEADGTEWIVTSAGKKVHKVFDPSGRLSATTAGSISGRPMQTR